MGDRMTSARPFRRRIVVNTASTAAGNVWAIVIALVTLPLLLRGLGTEAFGTWVLLQTFSAITGWFSLLDLGIGTASTRTVAGEAATGSRGVAVVVGSSLAVFAALGLACAVALAAIGPIVFPRLFHTPEHLVDELQFAAVVFAAQAAVDLLTEGIEACLEGTQRVDLSRLIDATRRTAVAVATCIAALAGGGLGGVAVASFGASTVGTVFAIVLLRATLRASGSGIDRLKVSREVVVELLRYGRDVAVLRPLGVLHRTMDRVIAGTVLGPSAVALVEIATQVQNGADAILSASSYAVVPSASWLSAREDESALRRLLLDGTRFSMLVTAPVVVGAAMLIDPLLRVWVGRSYGEAAGLAVVALLYVALTSPLQVGSNLLLGTGGARSILKAALIAVVINLVASLVLANTIGLVGVFLGTLVGTSVLVPLLGRSVIGEVRASPLQFVRQSVVPAILPTIAMILTIAAVRAAGLGDWPTIVVGGLLGLIAFAVTAVRFSLHRSERAEITRVAGRFTGRLRMGAR
jgi:O-antigen/teichoic acid export membrane protein